ESRMLLVRSITHELRGFLGDLRAAAQALDGKDELRARQRMLALVAQNLDDPAGPLNQLVDYSSLIAGIETPKIEPFDAAELFEEIDCEVRQIAEVKTQQLTFEAERDTALGGLVCDRAMIKRIIDTVIHYSLKFTEHGL